MEERQDSRFIRQLFRRRMMRSLAIVMIQRFRSKVKMSRDEEVQIFWNIWKRLADVLRVDLPDLKDYLGVDEHDAKVVAELTDQEIITEMKGMNEQDGEEEPKTAGAKINEITMLQAQQVINWLKRYTIKSDIPENVNKEYIMAAVKVDKHLMMTRI